MLNSTMKKIIAALLAVASVLLVACNSGNGDQPETSETTGLTSDTVADNTTGSDSTSGGETTFFDTDKLPDDYTSFTDYRIIISDSASSSFEEMTNNFATAFKKATSVELAVKNDWEGGPIKRTEKEIILGDTTRRDEFSTDTELSDGEFQLARRGEKIFCVGKDESATIIGIKYLVTVFLTLKNSEREELCTSDTIFGLKDGDTVTCDSFSRYKITETELNEYIASHDTINVVECHADSTGVVEATELLQFLHNSGKKIYYPNGNYLFNGETLCFDGGVEFESYDGVIIHNYISDNPIVNFDVFGNLVGLQQNHLEYKTGQEMTKHGSLVSPPLSTMKNDTDVDFMPIFYNDFGLMRSLTGQYGWTGWFYWSWNHQDNMETLDSPGYDPQRHPLLGWYYGDDPVVLDWICYWLRQYGINQMILLSTPYRDTWSDKYDSGYWHYQLFNNVKNFDEMEYVLEVANSGTRDTVLKHWKEVINYYHDYPHYYTQTVDGKKLAVVYNWQENVLCDSLGGNEGYAEFMKEVSTYAKSVLEVDGILVMSRASTTFTEAQTADLNANGVYHYAAGYEPNCVVEQNTLKTYEQYVENFDGRLANDNTVLAISTGMYSHSHPSNWTVKGNTPALFEEWATKAANYIRDSKRLLPIVTIYNISEWAEGGPGLQPNMQDGFGYLEAISNALGITPGKE